MFVATSVSSGTVVLVGAVFLASCVEMVEALTIVLAVGTHAWMAFRVRRHRCRALGLGRACRRLRPGARARSAEHLAPHRRRCALDLRDAVAAKVNSSRHGPQGEARRGRDLRRDRRHVARGGGRTGPRPRRLRDGFQGSLPRRSRGHHPGDHLGHLGSPFGLAASVAAVAVVWSPCAASWSPNNFRRSRKTR